MKYNENYERFSKKSEKNMLNNPLKTTYNKGFDEKSI